MPGRSRYDGLPTASLSVEDGAGGTREVSYLLPRTPLSPEQATPMAAHRVAPDDRLDLIATRYSATPRPSGGSATSTSRSTRTGWWTAPPGDR